MTDALLIGLVVLLIAIFIILLIREITCWYFKINERVELLKRIATALDLQNRPVPAMIPADPPPILSKPVEFEPAPDPDELEKLKAATDGNAIRFASASDKSWYCICGKLNPIEAARCGRCERYQDFVLQHYTREVFSGSDNS